MTTGELVNIYEALTALGKYEMSPAEAYKVAIIKSKLGSVYEEYTKARSSVIKKYGDEFNDHRGNGWEMKPSSPKIQSYIKDMQPINDVVTGIDIKSLPKLKLSDLGDKCQAAIIEIIMPLLDDMPEQSKES